ncbi:penicillin-binding transpeptidase domain-containing protein, partial [Mycolicibacterium sp. CBMA 361]
MATHTSSVSRSAALVAVVAVAGAMTACTPKPNGPEPTAQAFFAALGRGDTGAAADLSDKPNDARTALNQAWAGLQATTLDAQVLGSKYTQDTGKITYRYTWHLPKDRTWAYTGQLNMIRQDGRWQVRWGSTDLHPNLGEHQSFQLRADLPVRASVNELGGTNVLVPGYHYNYALNARSAAGELMRTSRVVADTLRQFDDTMDAQRLAEQASSSTGSLNLITLRREDNDKVSPVLAHLPGVVITPQPEMVPTDPRFAPAIVDEVKKQVGDQLVGQSGWRVVSVNQNGADIDVLNEVPGKPAASVTISLDRNVQNAAQDAVNMVGRKAMIVAIKPSTGEILAVAQNAAADTDGPTATMGLYPPGSTFKIVTAGAAIETDMAGPNTLLGCPGTIDIGQRTIPNYDRFDLGVVPMAKAFANSCNTTFAELASRMPPRALTNAAAQYGIGADYQVAGIGTVTGQVPPTVNLAERTEDGFGQGRVLVSPFGMALAAATVAAGKT